MNLKQLSQLPDDLPLQIGDKVDPSRKVEITPAPPFMLVDYWHDDRDPAKTPAGRFFLGTGRLLTKEEVVRTQAPHSELKKFITEDSNVETRGGHFKIMFDLLVDVTNRHGGNYARNIIRCVGKCDKPFQIDPSRYAAVIDECNAALQRPLAGEQP